MSSIPFRLSEERCGRIVVRDEEGYPLINIPNTPEDRKLCEFVVRACNSYDELVEVCKKFIFLTESGGLILNKDLSVVISVLNKAKQTLSKAEEGE